MSSSGERCKGRDIITPGLAGKWSRAFLGAKKRDEYNEPLTADAAWWQGLKAEEILLVASADECLTDDIARMGETLKVSRFFFFPLVFLLGLFLLDSVAFYYFRALAKERRRNLIHSRHTPTQTPS